MMRSFPNKRAFTLIELLVVVAIVGILTALLLPALARAKDSSRRTQCFSNLRQVDLAIRLYADDFAESLPVLPAPNPYPNGVGAYYKQLVKGYVGLPGLASPNEKVFICPVDRTICATVEHAFTSYTFNGYETGPADLPRITGTKLSAIRNPTKAVIAGEWPAFFGGSWHPLVKETRPDSKCILSYADGHVSSTKIYWDGIAGSQPRNYEPPENYDYRWDGD
jgi:prepilin-type N-terminal cleavage/methylation domain-containing protein